MTKYRLESIDPLTKANLVKCGGPITDSIDRLRQIGAFKIFVRTSANDLFRCDLEVPTGKKIPPLKGERTGCCHLREIDE